MLSMTPTIIIKLKDNAFALASAKDLQDAYILLGRKSDHPSVEKELQDGCSEMDIKFKLKPSHK